MIDYNILMEFKQTLYIIFIVLSAILVYFLSKIFLIPIIRKIIEKFNSDISKVFFKQKVFHYLIYLTPVPIIDGATDIFPIYAKLIEKTIIVYVTLIIIFLCNRIFSSILEIYNEKYGELSKQKPIKTFTQAGSSFVYVVGVLFIFSQIFNKSITTFISGLGALTALLVIVFKDSLLSFKAGMQLLSNDMLRIDDVVEIPKFNAEGSVMEISLDAVKIRNWDNTITFIPTYKLMEEPFINWRGMLESGARRIYRSIIIDQHSIRFLDQKDIEKYKNFHLIEEYIKNKKIEVDNYNIKNNINTDYKVNGENLTNIGTFRIYVLNYLKQHKYISQNFEVVVRQQSPTPEGFPIQIYAFTNQVELKQYEQVQADIFDHILAIVSEFDLKIYQKS
ncbi:MAG: mechanosensitive ion channel [Candidatus Sericytochromatia bacterium]